MNQLRAIALGLLIATAFTAAHTVAANAPTWVNVTNNVGGDNWGAYGVTYMKAIPNSDRVIAGVSEVGLWVTADNGATWTALGNGETKHRPGRIVFDPKDVNTFWVSGCYGDCPHRTTDGGKTFTHLGKLAHADGIAVDFTDPQRQTLLLGLHEQSQSLQRSTDGGKTWTRIGEKLPPGSNHSTDPICLDAKTCLINTAGWKQKTTHGIYRTEDAGETWTKVSDLGPTRRPTGRHRQRDLLGQDLGRRPPEKQRCADVLSIAGVPLLLGGGLSAARAACPLQGGGNARDLPRMVLS